MKSILHACARLLNGIVIGVLLLSSVTFISTPAAALPLPILGDPLKKLAPVEVLPVDPPTLTSPADGSSYRAASLPVTQTWTGMPNATSYVYESYTSNPETGAASVYETDSSIDTRHTISKSTPEGTYWWRVKAKSVTSTSGWSSVRSFIIDNTKPVSVHDAPLVMGTTATITQRIDDASPKEGSLTVTKLENGAQYVSPVEQVNENDQIIYTLEQGQLFGDGEYEADFYARDKAGNESHTTFIFTLDTVGPEVTADGPNEGLSGETITLTGTVAEPDAEVVVTIDSIGYPAVVNEGTWSADIDTTSLSVGEYEVLVSATDPAGNTSTVTTTLNITGVALPEEGVDLEGREVPPLPLVFRTPPLIAGMPLITTPSTTNVQEPEPEETVAEEEDPPGEVEGASSGLTSFAQANDTDSTDGSFWGIDWYWWLLIVGGGVTGIGWIVASVRRGPGA